MTKRVLICAIFIAAAAALWGGGNDISELRGLSVQGAKLPLYNRQMLQTMIFCNRAERQGELVVSTDAVMDLVRKGTDVDRILNSWGITQYRLNSDLPVVLDFWKDRLYSDGVIVTPRADVNQSIRMAAGNEAVYFRSPVIDLDGIGFEADFSKRTILVKDDVHVVLRTRSSDPRILLGPGGEMPQKYEFVTADSDSLLIDMVNKHIMLVGNVKVDEASSVINCDRMTIYLDRKEEQNGIDADPFGGLGGEGNDDESFGNVSRVVCNGNVKVTRKNELKDGVERGGESARSEQLDYDFSDGTARLAGNVRVDDKRMLLECGRMRVDFSDGQPSSPVVERSESSPLADFGGLAGRKGGRALEGVDCSDGVKLTRKNAIGKLLDGEYARSDKAYFDYRSGDVIMTGGKPTLRRERESLSGDKLIVKLNDSRVIAQNNSKVEMASSAAPAAGEQPAPAVITSDSCDLNYGGNLLVFDRSVKLRDPSLKLDCDKMEIYLADTGRESGGRKKAADILDGGTIESSDKHLDRIVCLGRVRANDGENNISADKLVLNFRTVAPDAPLRSGMFRSGVTELFAIDGEGDLVLVRADDSRRADPAKAATPLSGMLAGGGNRTLRADRGRVDFDARKSEFHGLVAVNDQNSTLKCDNMYLYAEETAAPAAPSTPARSIDDDPFAMASAIAIPADIKLSDDLSLSRVHCVGNVRLDHRDKNGALQSAGGGEADYVVAQKQIVLTDAPPQRQPWMSAEGGRLCGDRVLVFVEEERMLADGNVKFVAAQGIEMK